MPTDQPPKRDIVAELRYCDEVQALVVDLVAKTLNMPPYVAESAAGGVYSPELVVNAAAIGARHRFPAIFTAFMVGIAGGLAFQSRAGRLQLLTSSALRQKNNAYNQIGAAVKHAMGADAQGENANLFFRELTAAAIAAPVKW